MSRTADRFDRPPDFEEDHVEAHQHRERMESDMKERHSDMLVRRAERYKERAEKSSLAAEDRTLFDTLLEKYVMKERDMMESRMDGKRDRMRPSGDMRDPEVKDQFKADLRRSIDERKETDKATRDELRDLRQQIEEMLNSHPGSDL
jgi:hypothetical protein